MIARLDAYIRQHDSHLVNAYTDNSGCRCSCNTYTANILDVRVRDPCLTAGAHCDVNAVVVEAKNLALIYNQRSAGDEADSTEPGIGVAGATKTVEPKVPQNHNVACGSRDHDSVGSSNQN